MEGTYKGKKNYYQNSARSSAIKHNSKMIGNQSLKGHNNVVGS